MLGAMGIAISGRIHVIFATKQVTPRFQKREFVLELADNSKYPQRVLFQLTGDRCDRLDEFNQGDEVRVEFSLRGREWTSPQGEIKYFNSLDVWTLEQAGTGRGSRRDSEDEPPFPSEPPSDLDNLPF